MGLQEIWTLEYYYDIEPGTLNMPNPLCQILGLSIKVKGIKKVPHTTLHPEQRRCEQTCITLALVL